MDQTTVLVIDNDDGLRTMLDAVVRCVGTGGTGIRVLPDHMVADLLTLLMGQLAGKPLEALRAIASLVQSLPHSGLPDVHLGSATRAGLDFVVSLGAERRVLTRDDGPIEHASICIEGVYISALYHDRTARPPSAEMAVTTGQDAT